MKKTIAIVTLLSLAVPSELYKLIRVSEVDSGLIEEMQIIGIDIDHYTYDETDKSIEFAIPQSHLDRLVANNISFSVIDDDLEAF